MSERDPAHALVGSMYDAVLAPAGFQHFIETLRVRFQLKAVTMVIRHVATQEIKGLWICGLEKKWLDSYALEYASEDLLALHLMSAPIALFYASNLDVPQPDHFIDTRFYREWVAPQGVACAAGGIILREGDWLTQVIVQRGVAQPPFTRGDLDGLNELVPHLQRAIQMRQRFAELQLGQSFMAGSLDVLAMPTVLFDEYGRVAHTNRSATLALQSRTDLWVEDGHLFTRDSATTRSLNLELAKAVQASRGGQGELDGVVLLQRRGRMPLMLMVTPLRLAGAAGPQGAALLFVFDPEKTLQITADTVKRLFGLSRAEAELAVALSCGKTLDDAAAERGISVHTTRSQLKTIFNKTGTKRQADLVSLLLSSPAYFLAKDQAAPVQRSSV